MTIPKIRHVFGNRSTEKIVLTCTGCNEYYEYSVRQYKGDFGCNITEFNHFVNWAMWEAAKHDCFEAGSRTGFIGPDFPQVETREEDPWGGVGYVVEPEDDELGRILREAVNPLMQGDAPDGTPYAGDDDALSSRSLHEWLNEEGYWPGEFDDDEDEEEEAFGFLEFPFGFGDDLQGSITGRLRDRFQYEMQDPHYVIKLEGRLPDPTEFDVTYIEVDTDEGERIGAVIEFDYASLEQHIFEILAEDAGIYTRDAQGNLRDEKGRCLACLRPGVHR